MNRLGLLIAGAITFALVAFFLMLGTSGGGVGIGSEVRTTGEQRERYAAGRCAVRRDGTPVGRVIGQHGPSRGNPQLRYVVEERERKRVIQVYASEVRLVPCASVPDTSAP